MELLKDITRELPRNMGGGDTEVFYIRHSDIAVWPTLPVDDGTHSMDALVKYTGNFILKPGARFKTLRCVEDTVMIQSDDQGELEGMSQSPYIQFVLAGNDAEVLGLQAATNNRGLVFVGADKEGNLRVVGTEKIPARKRVQNTTTGDTAAARKQGTFTFFTYSHVPAPLYTGTLDLESGSGSGG